MKNQRKSLQLSATGTQETLNDKCTFSSSLYIVCMVLELHLVFKSQLRKWMSLARAAASASCVYVSQGAGFELCRLPGLDGVAQMREHPECLRFKTLCIFRSAQLLG